jgi:hypothetical protein
MNRSTTMRKNDRGYMLITTLFVLTLSLIVTGGMLDLTATNSKTRALVKTQADYYYEVEATLSKTVTWLQSNSQNIVNAFSAANFENNFELGSPAIGDNEGEEFQVPTMLKLKNSNTSVMLSNNDFFGEAAFPTTTNISTGESFDAVSAFKNADLGSANARAVIIWARESDGDYAPVFRVDVVTGNNPDRGVHSYTYVYSHLVSDIGSSGGGGSASGVGFFTQNASLETKTGNNQCFSYLWTYEDGAWNKGSPRSNCIVASNQNIVLESRINGNAFSKISNGIAVNHPNGDVSGNVCAGPSCVNHSIAPYDDWDTTCSGYSQGNITVSSNMNLASGPNLSDQCWHTVSINSNTTLTLTDTEHPYRFKVLLFQNNSHNSRLAIPILPPEEKVTIYTDSFSGGELNGNQLFNINNAPRNLVIKITSNQSFTLNGTADMNARFIAPASYVVLDGNFSYHGAIEASQLYISGNSRFNYDEGIDITADNPPVPMLSDMKFSLKKASQRYR